MGSNDTENEALTTTGFLVRAAVVAAGYYLAGKTGLLPAISPGFATAVWPASGVALAAILLFGYRMWPAVLLGAILINVELSIDGYAQGPSRWAAVTFSVALGSTLQAVVSAFLIRRFLGFPNPLNQDSAILRFLLLGSPIGCLIGPTWGMATLLVGGSHQWNTLPLDWFTWWVGDAIGVLIFTPLILVWFAEPRRIWRPRRFSLTVALGIAFSVTVSMFMLASQWEDRRLRLEFEQQASRITHNLELHLTGYMDVLHSIDNLYGTSSDVSRENFQTFAHRHHQRLPAIQALEWIPYVSDEQRDYFEREAHSDGLAGFMIRERSAQKTMIPAARRPGYYPVYYVEPMAGNEAALGFDLASNATRLAALNQARDSGRSVATAPITLVQEKGEQAAFLVFLPVYHGDNAVALTTVAERRDHLRGFVLGVFRTGDVIEGAAVSDLVSSGVDLLVEDRAAAAGTEVLYDSRNHDSKGFQVRPEPEEDKVMSATAIDVGGRQWHLSFIPTSRYLAAQVTWHLWMVLVGGVLFAGLLGAVLLMMSGRAERVALLVEERTAELTEVNADLTDEITERRRIQQELVEAKLNAEQADRTKSEFLANMSHELRTPLNAIIGYSELLKEDADEAQQTAASSDLGQILSAGRHLLALISDVLDLSKIEARKMEVSLESFEPESLINEVVAMVEPLVEKNGNSLEVEIGDVGTAYTDQTKVRQVLFNLLSNAAKFTERGAIVLRCRAFQEGVATWLEYQVTDTGIGMTEAQMEQVFEAFSQADSSTTRLYGGTGLGLAITKSFCQLLGGVIEAKSQMGVGSTFTVRLPATLA